MQECSACGRESPSDARFCANCGAALATQATAREERKVVSVVFVDLVGHTARSEAADPEDVRATLAPYHAHTREVLERFGGTVEKFIGDAVMAVFGAPIAHEDDPERAVRAALAVRDGLVDDGLEVRAAVNTGEALVSLGAGVTDGEALVAGDVVNTAARLQSAAPVNGVLVGAGTHRATERAIEYREVAPVAAKGKSSPVAAWEAVAPRARLGVDVAHHGAAELVGRELELRALSDALERARGARAMQLVTLVGAPGMGKSRLVWELLRQIEDEPEFTHWRQGRALSYGGGAFGAIAEAVRAQIGMLESDGPVEVAEKLRVSLDALPLAADERGWVEARVGPLVGIDTGDRASRDESFVAWRKLFEAVADVFPLVLVLEDLHWADDGTLEFVEHLLDWSADTPLLVLCTARPELLERRPAWGGGRLNSNALALTPLSDEATARLFGQLLDRPLLAADVQSRLLQQAGGNPLYAEEYARIVDQGDAASLPDTVQGVIAARLDALEIDEKELLQTASVLGKVFWSGGIAALGAGEAVDERLQRLVRKEFLRRERSTSMTGEMEFAFRHALVRDVAYSQLPRASRATKHCLAAAWIASVAAHRPDLVAYHYAEALELLHAYGGETAAVEERARVAFRSAGDHARSLGALAEAQQLYRAAIALWADDADLPHLWIALAEVQVDASPNEARESATVARDACAELADAAGVSHAEALMASASWGLGEGSVARAHLDEAVAAANRSGSRSALARAKALQARLLMVAGSNEEAIAVGLEAIELSEAENLPDSVVNAMVAVGSAAGNIGADGWEDRLVAAADRARANNDLGAVQRALNNRANCLRALYGVGRSMPTYDEMVAHTARFPLPFGVRWVAGTVTSLHYLLGRWAEALEHADRFDSVDPDARHYLEAQVALVRGAIAFARGDSVASELAFAAALSRARGVGDFQLHGTTLAHAAWILVQDGRIDEARELVDELLGLPTGAVREAADYGIQIGWLGVDLEPKLVANLSDLMFNHRINRAISDGRLTDAIEGLDGAGAATEASYVRLRLAERSLQAGDDPEPWLSDAESFYRGVGARRYLGEIEELRATRRSA